MISVNSNSVMPMSYVRPSNFRTANTSDCLSRKDKTQFTPAFCSNVATPEFRTSLSTKEEKEKFKAISQKLDKAGKSALNGALKTGKLLNSDSNDNTTVLDSIYKMVSTPRADGIDPSIVARDTLTAIYNPHTITQKFGNIPDEYKESVLNTLTNNSHNLIEKKKVENDLENMFSGCCVAASEEFNLAQKKPAEFARFAEGLTSPNKGVEKNIKLDSLSENTLDAIWLLDAFEIPYKAKDFKTATIKLAPDNNAYTRAQIQEKYRDNLERSPIDVLMQSTFMNVGSQQTYNSLNDKRAGKFSSEDSGLIDYEKTFLESVVEDKNVTSVTYQNVDDNQKIVGYTTDYDTVKNQLLETLNRGKNIIIGYTLTDENKKIIGAHEITVIGSRTDKNGNLFFKCNDTDDDISEPIEYPATYIIPKIHHAGIPEDIASRDLNQTDTWRLNLREMNNKKQK